VIVLAGDIGATHARLALFEVEGGRIASILEEEFQSAAFAGLEPILERFFSAPVYSASASGLRPRGAGATDALSSPGVAPREPPGVERACFGVPGAVEQGATHTTNLPWEVDSRRLAAVLGLQPARVELINDLEAWAWGMDALAPEDSLVLQEGRPDPSRPLALIAAGTGLGEAVLLRDGGRSRPVPSEGGHADLAPNGLLQAELWRYLHAKFGHVSWERVLSGPGLVNTYEFLRGYGDEAEPAWLTEELRARDPGAVITGAALAERDRVCVKALDLFISVYGAEAGNMALRLLAQGGVFLGGGIAPHIVPRLRGPGFIEAFLGKGRMRPLMEQMPVRVILNERTAILGAALCAARGSP
jgi:glucokinase